MKKYIGCIPLVAVVNVDIEAENEDEAFDKLIELYKNNQIDTNGYNPEPPNYWWVEENIE